VLVGLSALLVPLLGCADGAGEGEVTGAVLAPECGIDNTAWDLRPNFFVQDTNLNSAIIRVQRGSDYQDLSNGIVVSVADIDEVQANLGVPFDLADPDSPITITLTLSGTCQPGRRDPSVVLMARGGSITFDALYDPRDDAGPETSASFTGLVMDDGEDPPSTATLDGWFSFLFARGRPGQRFP
jgi:hypothetical protein